MTDGTRQNVMRHVKCLPPWPLSRRREKGGVGTRGMTLVELLVVLTILAILSAVAVVSTDSVLSQGRFEATQRTMCNVEEAVLGPDVLRTEDGTVATAGFVADIGRLPVAVDIDGEMQPAELWENVLGLPAFSFKQATADLVGAAHADPDVVVPCGWRGPYLRLPVGGDYLADGWGGELALLASDRNTPVGDGEQLAVIRCLGSDGLVGEEPGEAYTRDVEIAFVSTVPPVINRYQTDIGVTVWQRDADGNLEIPSGSGQLVVRLFCPEEGSVGVVFNDPPIPLSPPPTAPPSVQFVNVAMGPHVIRAYEELAGVRVRTSPPLEIQIHPQGPANWQLILPANTSP